MNILTDIFTYAYRGSGKYLSGSSILSIPVMALVGAYTLMTNARILGVVYRERQEELGWL